MGARLLGNSPNPFRDQTEIAYELTRAVPVRLAVFDISGQMLHQLVDEVQEAGRYRVRFEAGDLPSGTYLVRLVTPQGPTSAKMLLLK